jgi:peptidoglycan/LPS O-acetylase OafA/YrhL
METLTDTRISQPTTSQSRGAALPALTGLRFFAAIYVVFYHFVSPDFHTSIKPLQNILSAGYSAVGFFFVLSGFVLSYSYLRLDRQATLNRVSFWKARFSRIYPAYLLAFLLAAPFQIFGSLHVNHWRVALEKLTLGGVLVLTLLQAWTPWTAWYWNIPAWSLSVEVFCYFCFPFAALVVGKLRSRACLLAAAGVWLLGLIVPVLYCALRHIEAQPPFPMMQLAIETNPLLRLPEFLIGMLAGRIFARGLRWDRRVVPVLSILALALFILALSCSSILPRLLLSNSILTPISALLIFTLAHQSGALAKFLSFPVLTVLGEASYAIYILQYPVSYLLKLNHETFSGQRFLIFLAALIGFSIFTFYFLEQPLRRRLASKKEAVARNTDVPVDRSRFVSQRVTI